MTQRRRSPVLSLLLAPALASQMGCITIIDPVTGTGGGASSSTSSSTGTSGGGGSTPASGSCDVAGGLQPGAPWPMLGGCPTHRALSAFAGAQTNQIKWSADVSIKNLTGVSLSIDASGTIYVPTGVGVIAFDASGAQKWESFTSAFGAPVIAADGAIYVAAAEVNGLRRLSPADGSTLGFGPPRGNEHASLAIAADGTVVIPSGSGLVARSSGGSSWSINLSSVGLDSSPAIAPNGAIFVSTASAFVSVDPNGSIAWNHAFPQQNTLPTPTIAPDGTIYVGDGPTLHALTPAGAELWSATPGADPAILEWVAIGPDGTLYVVDTYDSAAIYALSPQDGSVKWAFNVGGNYAGAPVVGADGIVYVSLDQALYALRPNGTQLWTFDVDAACGTPAIGADGTTYVVCGGKLYALGP